MKPGNLFIKVPNPAETKDEETLERTEVCRCACFFVKRKEMRNGKKTVYF